MNCPTCGAELIYDDYYGLILPHQSGQIVGDIYRCETCALNGDERWYHATKLNPEEPVAGYPC